MEDLTARICWELVKKEGYIAIWKKPSNNSFYLNRDTRVKPSLCDGNDDPDNVWYVPSLSFNFTRKHYLFIKIWFFSFVLVECIWHKMETTME